MAKSNTAPKQIWSLTQEQAGWMRDAAATAGGAYIPVTAPAAIHALVEGGAAEYREVKQSGGTKSVRDSRPCEWTDYYLVPTAYGLKLLST